MIKKAESSGCHALLAPSVSAVRESTQEQRYMVLLSRVVDCEDYLEYTKAINNSLYFQSFTV